MSRSRAIRCAACGADAGSTRPRPLRGIAAGAAGGYALVRVAALFLTTVELPGVLPVMGATAVLIGAAAAASLMPAARASRVDVMQALRSE
jgi:putative ABC transport system permease protein